MSKSSLNSGKSLKSVGSSNGSNLNNKPSKEHLAFIERLKKKGLI